MALSDNEITKNVPSKRRRAVDGTGRRWSDSQKIEAVTTYLMLGNLSLTAATLKIPRDTLKVWKASEWWKTMENELRVQDDLQISNKLKKILDKSIDVISDRLENGDFIYDTKSGEILRKPVSMKDANSVAKDMSDRRDVLIDRHISGSSVTADKITETLNSLAASFAKIAQQTNPVPVTIEAEDVEYTEDNDAPNES
jgi:hypothetical protein